MKLARNFTKTSAATLWSSVLLLAHSVGVAAGFDLNLTSSATTVGEYGNLSRVSFVGNKTFGEDALRRSLRSDLDSVIVIQPDAALDECLRTLERRLRTGYQHAGFPEAEVRAETDSVSRRIVLRIAEGPRFFCGGVRVTGLTTLNPERVKARIVARIASNVLTNPPSSPLASVGEKDSPARDLSSLLSPPDAVTPITNRSQVAEIPLGIWEQGLPAPMDAAARRSLAEAVTNAFADLGYFKTQFTLDFARRVKTDGDLVVEIQDEGPACTIGEIEVDPLRKHSPAELLRWLGLASGQRLTRELLFEKQDQLVESGRFTVAMLEPGTPDATGKVKLRVAVTELDVAPPLSVELSPDEAALQRLRRWLQDWSTRGEDAVLSLNAKNADGTKRLFAELIASPGGGLFFRMNRAGDPAAAPDWVFHAGSNVVALIDGVRREGICTTNWHGSLKIVAALGVDPDGAGNCYFGGGFGSNTSAPPFNVELHLLPAAFIRLARSPEGHWLNERGVLTGSSSNVVLRTDARTGRLIELRFRANGSATDVIGSLSSLSNAEAGIVLQFKTNALARAVSDAMAATAGFTNRYDSRRPWSSVLAFLAGEALRSPFVGKLVSTNVTAEGIAAATSTLGKLLDCELFAAWERTFGSTNPAAMEAAFIIPPDAGASGGYNPLDAVAALVLGNTAELVAPDSWVGTVLCEKALSVSRRADLVGKGWERLFTAAEIGPLACLVAARNVSSAGARAFAIRGVTRLSRDDFHRDCQALLEGDGAIPATVRTLLVRLAALDDSEIESLAAALPCAEADALREAARALRQPNASPTLATLGPTLDRWWDASLRARMSAALRHWMTNH
jgi:hypothetical protein